VQLGAQPNINAAVPIYLPGTRKNTTVPITPSIPSIQTKALPHISTPYQIRRGQAGQGRCACGRTFALTQCPSCPCLRCTSAPPLLAEGIWEGVCRAATAAMCASTVDILWRC